MCLQPIVRTRTLGNLTKQDILPCGWCSECLKRKQSEIVVRCIEESKKTGNMIFITLTYSDFHLKKVRHFDDETGEFIEIPTLCREDVKTWKREVRKRYFRDFSRHFPKFSYLICGEYGPKSYLKTGFGRPHYHGVLFGLDAKHSNILQKYWEDNYGFAVFKKIPLSLNSHDDVGCVARYVSKYCVKPEEIKNYWVNKKVIEAPRKQTSIGFGLPEDFEQRRSYYLLGYDKNNLRPTAEDADKINSRLKYEYNGFNYAFPTYYRKKLLYEKSPFKDYLVSSPLSKVLAYALRRGSIEDFNRQLSELVAGKDEREVTQIISSFVDSQNFNNESSERLGRETLLKEYKSSAF